MTPIHKSGEETS